MLVTILNGNALIESRASRRVRLPDGRPGAVWRGLAYALFPDGSSINVESEGISPRLCGRMAGDPPTVYALIEGASETYVLVAGSVIERERTSAGLAAAGLTVIRSGRYLGEAVDGLAADWFVRVVTPPEGFATLRALLEDRLGAPAPASAETASLRVQLLGADLAAAQAREAHDRAEIELLRAALAARAVNEGELASLQAAFEDEKRAREALEAAADAPRTSASEQVAAPSGRLARRLGEEIGDVMASLLPRVVLIRGSEDLIAAEFSNRRRLYAALLELGHAGAEVHPKWKALQGVDKWIERHVSNGQSDAGRIYARRRPDDRRWDVLVSHKGEQARDIAWLRDRG